jgi:hypothetical protein
LSIARSAIVTSWNEAGGDTKRQEIAAREKTVGPTPMIFPADKVPPYGAGRGSSESAVIGVGALQKHFSINARKKRHINGCD